MALMILDDDGNANFSLTYGKPMTGAQLSKVLGYAMFAEATGLELDECRKILGRHVAGPKHRFSQDATQEIVLNWAR